MRSSIFRILLGASFARTSSLGFWPIVRSMIGYWHDTDVCPSVCLSLNLCIVAKRHILQQKCLNK